MQHIQKNSTLPVFQAENVVPIKDSAQTTMLITFPDIHEQGKSTTKKNSKPGSLFYLLNHYQFDYIVLFLFPHLAPNKENLITLLQQAAPHSKVQFIDCTEFTKINAIDLATYLQYKICEIRPNYLEQRLSVCLGGFVYISLQAAVLNLCMLGTLSCRLIMVRPVRRLSSSLSMFDEVDFCVQQPVVQKDEDETLADHIKIAKQFGIVGIESLKNNLDMCKYLAPTLFPILILGETGTGKGLFAKYIHALSARPEDIFVEINCAAIPDTLVESVLFGHKKGSFTGAVSDQAGKFVQANGGTLFLDEIGDMPMATQAKILKVLEDGYVDVLGSRNPVKVNVKIIAATNCNLQEKIEEGTFRADLYYRLQVGEIILPSLKERPQDIREIALQSLQRFNKTSPLPKLLTSTALMALEQYPWKGNIRELDMTLKRALLVSPKNIIEPSDIFPKKNQSSSKNPTHTWIPGTPIESLLRQIRDNAFAQALEISAGNQSAAARLLGVTHQAMNQFIKRKNTN